MTLSRSLPEKHVSTDQLELDLGWALAVVSRAYREVAASAVDALPGGPRGLHLLEAIAGDTPRTQLALSRRLGIDKSATTYLLDDLEAARLVERQPDPHDRRARQVRMTASGSRTLKRLRENVAKAETQLLATLDQAEQATLRALLQRVACDTHVGREAENGATQPEC